MLNINIVHKHVDTVVVTVIVTVLFNIEVEFEVNLIGSAVEGEVALEGETLLEAIDVEGGDITSLVISFTVVLFQRTGTVLATGFAVLGGVAESEVAVVHLEYLVEEQLVSVVLQRPNAVVVDSQGSQFVGVRVVSPFQSSLVLLHPVLLRGGVSGEEFTGAHCQQGQ